MAPLQDRVEKLLEASAAAFDAGELEEALARAEDALAIEPASVAALHHRAAALAELGRVEEAQAAYEKALVPGRDDAELLLGAADFFANLQAGEDEREDEGRLERAVELAKRGTRLARKTGDDPLAGELALVQAAALNQLGRPREALERLDAAGTDLPESADALLERASALLELCRFGEARAAAERAEALEPDSPWAHHLLGLLAERRGEDAEARRRFAKAHRVDPDAFPLPVGLSHAEFERVVEEALGEIPEEVRRYLANVPITVEDFPADHDLLGSDPPLSPGVLGLFRGSPYGEKAAVGDPWSHFPSSIVLYQRNLERYAHDRDELVDEIGVTLVHEVGHFLGLDEDELWERGLG
jgi:predicted Zn-dependent protease with MMP-like domain/Tfp pilus assembly protein PilF